MNNIFYILAVIAVGAAAFTGWQIKDKTNTQIEVRDEVAKTNKKLTKNINDKTDERVAATEAKDASLSEKDEVVAKLDVAKSNFQGFERTIESEEDRLAVENKRAADVDKVVAAFIEQIGDPNIQLEEIPGIVEEKKEKKKALDRELAELENIRGSLEITVKNTAEEITRVTGKIAESKARIKGNNFAATVATVDNDWGFIVINAGEKSVLAVDSKLLLTRDGRMLGKVLVSSLEANQAIAELVPGSFVAGVRAQAGDVVILADTAAN